MNFSIKRDTAPDVVEADLSKLVNGISAFAFALYQAVRESGEDNLIFSPYSVSLALAMTYAGAHTTTEQAIADTMHYLLPQDRLHPALNTLDLDLTKRAKRAKQPKRRAKPARDAKSERFQLYIANAIWGQEGLPFKEEFLATIGMNYGAGLQTLDFVQQPEKCRQVINRWVEDQTEDRIKDIVPPGRITSLTRLVLANAIYFYASWLHPFEEYNTKDEPFTLLDDSRVTVPMMSQKENFGYSRGKGYQAVGLPYFGGDIEMIAILPDKGRFEAIEQRLNADLYNDITRSMVYTDVRLSMPRYKSETNLRLTDILTGMGMGEAFTDKADFSGMSEEEELFISDVLHKAFIKVDESGTEAAAATVVVMRSLGVMPQMPIVVKLDRPFILSIRDRQTGTILFLGRVMNPAS